MARFLSKDLRSPFALENLQWAWVLMNDTLEIKTVGGTNWMHFLLTPTTENIIMLSTAVTLYQKVPMNIKIVVLKKMTAYR